MIRHRGSAYTIMRGALVVLAALIAEPQRDAAQAKEIASLSASKDEEPAIGRAIKSGHAFKDTFYFVFEPRDVGCGRRGGQSATVQIGGVRFVRHGIQFEFVNDPEGGVEMYTLQNADPPAIIGIIKTDECIIRLSVRKFVKAGGEWVAAPPARVSEITNWDERETRRLAHPPSDFNFLFKAGDDEACPRGVRMAVLGRSSLVSEGNTLEGTAEPRKSSPYERRFEIARETCKYEMTARQFVRKDGVFVPVRGRYLEGGDFER